MRSDGDHVSVHSCDTDSQISTTSSLDAVTRPIAELMKGIGEVDRSWGSSSDRFLDLRDGRRLRIPVDLRAPMTKSHQDEEIARKLVEWVSTKRDEAESDEGEGEVEKGLGCMEGGLDTDGVDVSSPPTGTATDWALVALTEMGASTPTIETMVPVDGGADGLDCHSLGLEVLGTCNGGSNGVMGDTVHGHE